MARPANNRNKSVEPVDQWPPEDEAADEPALAIRPNKTALKRQMHALQQLGDQLAAMPTGRLKRMPLSDALRDAIALYQNIKPRAREGRRRQSQLIGKLMRNEDVGAITALLDNQRQRHREQSLAEQQFVDWRSRLINDDAALDEFINAQAVDDDFRALVIDARREHAAGSPPHAQRKLLRTIHKILAHKPEEQS